MTFLKCTTDSSGTTAWTAEKAETNTAYATDSTPLCVQAATCSKSDLTTLLSAEGLKAEKAISDAAEQSVGQYYSVACDTGKKASLFSSGMIRCFSNGDWTGYGDLQKKLDEDGAMCTTAKNSCTMMSSRGKSVSFDDGRTMSKGDNCNTCTCNDGTVECTEKTCQACTKTALQDIMASKQLKLYSKIYEKEYVQDNNPSGRTFLLKCTDGYNHQGSSCVPERCTPRFYVKCKADGTWEETVSNCVGKQQSCTGSDGKVVPHGEKLYKDCNSWCVFKYIFFLNLLFPLSCI